MSGHNIEHTLPPGDRDDAPSFDLGEALRDIPLQVEAPPSPRNRLPDLPQEPALRAGDIEDKRLTKLERCLAEGLKEVLAANRCLSKQDRLAYLGAISRCAPLLTEAATLARLLADPPASRAKE